VAALAASPAITRTYRSYAWVWPLAAGSPRLWQVDDVIGRVERARATLNARSGSFSVSGPEEELRAAERRANVHSRRLLLVGGEAAALLLAFALLAARGMRRDLEEERRRLTWYGARRWQLALLTIVESAIAALGGVLVGWSLGIAVGAVAARLAGAPTVPVLVRSAASPKGLAIAGAVALVTTGLIAVAVSLRSREGTRIGAPEIVGAGALLVVGVSLLNGAMDEGLTAEGPAMLLLVLPGLVALVAAIAVARVFPWLARLVADRAGIPLSFRLAAVGLALGPGTAVVTVAFLTIAFGLALLAEGYRATLARGEREQAAFQVPLDVAVREDFGTLVRVFDAAPLERFRALAGSGGDAYPVLRVTGGAGRAEQVTGVTVLGLDGGVVEQLGVWRSEWASGADRDELARIIDPGQAVALRGIPSPTGELALHVGASLISFVALVETPSETSSASSWAQPIQTARPCSWRPPGSRSSHRGSPASPDRGWCERWDAFAGAVASRARGASPRLDRRRRAALEQGCRASLRPHTAAFRTSVRQPTDDAPRRLGHRAWRAGGGRRSLPEGRGRRRSVGVAGVVDRFRAPAIVVGDRGLSAPRSTRRLRGRRERTRCGSTRRTSCHRPPWTRWRDDRSTYSP
jgi:hypothetical protein